MSNVKTVNFKGKPYVMVGERVRQVYEQKRDFEVLDSVFQEIAGRVICKVTILVDGKRFTGNAEAKLVGAAPKSADETNPLECAETSALGRALAFANFGTVDGIASLDEIARSMTPDEISSAVNGASSAPAQPRQSASVAPGNSVPKTAKDALTDLLERTKARAESLGVLWDDVKRDAGLSNKPDGQLQPFEIGKINGTLGEYEKRAKSRSAA